MVAKMKLTVLLLVMTVALVTGLSVPSHFYPAGVSEGDTVDPPNDDGSTGPIPLAVPFNFFGTSTSTLVINTNGVLTFEGTLWQYRPVSFPTDINHNMIAPFWADVDTRRNSGRLYWRKSTDPDILARATNDVTDIYCGNFEATYVIIATWYEVTYFGGYSSSPVNTFQSVLITNGQESFVMFNYGDINWLYGTASNSIPAQVGLNAYPDNYFNHPDSLTPAIIDVETSTNVNIHGRWMFQTGGEVQQYSCCCSGRGSGDVNVNTYDRTQLQLVSTGKTLLSRWNQDPDDQCKFTMRAVTKDDINSVSKPLHYDWVGFAVGVHPNKNTKEFVNIMFAQDTAGNRDIGIRGQGYEGIERVAFNAEGIKEIYIGTMKWTLKVKNEHWVSLTPDSCPYTLNWYPNALGTKWDLQVGSKYQDGSMEGMCGDCNGHPVDDWRLCPSGPEVTQSPANIPIIAESCKDGKNQGDAFPGGKRLGFI